MSARFVIVVVIVLGCRNCARFSRTLVHVLRRRRQLERFKCHRQSATCARQHVYEACNKYIVVHATKTCACVWRRNSFCAAWQRSGNVWQRLTGGEMLLSGAKNSVCHKYYRPINRKYYMMITTTTTITENERMTEDNMQGSKI